MPRKKKRPIDMTTDEAIRSLFPGRVVTALKQTIEEDAEHKESKGKRSTKKKTK